jgi:MFS family permease
VLTTCLPSVLRSMVITWMLTAAIVVIILMTPSLVQSVFHVAPPRAFLGNAVASLTLALGCLFYGWLADRLGQVRSLVLGALAMLACSYLLYLDLRAGAVHFVALYALAGFSVGVVGVVPSLMVGAFPPAVRFSGLSFSYNIAYAIFGGLTPPLIGLAVKRFGVLAPAHYVAITAVVAILAALSMGRAARKPRA